MKKSNLFLAILLLAAFVQPRHASAQVTLNLKFFIQGYYVGGGLMRPVMRNQSVSGATTTQTDTVLIELHTPVSPYSVIQSVKTVLMTNGTASAFFSSAVIGNSYYIAVIHRNSIQTWSALPIAMSSVTNYDFSSAATQAYGNNMMQMAPGVWAFYSGDVNQDQNIDLIDFTPIDFYINNGLYGYYPADLNGDGNVDLFDFIIFINALNFGIFSQHL